MVKRSIAALAGFASFAALAIFLGRRKPAQAQLAERSIALTPRQRDLLALMQKIDPGPRPVAQPAAHSAALVFDIIMGGWRLRRNADTSEAIPAGPWARLRAT